jgi:hypothetical protein
MPKNLRCAWFEIFHQNHKDSAVSFETTEPCALKALKDYRDASNLYATAAP